MDQLRNIVQSFAQMAEDDFNLSENFWQAKAYKKGDFFNEYKNVCKHLGVVMDGVFRTYYIDDKTGEEKNMYFYSENQVVVAYKSFVSQSPCNYYTAALTDATIYYISIEQLQKLYSSSHAWERLGRLIAETAFSIGNDKVESFILQTPEERYQALVHQHPLIFNQVPLYHLASYLGIQGPSLSRIRKRMAAQNRF